MFKCMIPRIIPLVNSPGEKNGRAFRRAFRYHQGKRGNGHADDCRGAGGRAGSPAADGEIEQDACAHYRFGRQGGGFILRTCRMRAARSWWRTWTGSPGAAVRCGGCRRTRGRSSGFTPSPTGRGWAAGSSRLWRRGPLPWVLPPAAGNPAAEHPGGGVLPAARLCPLRSLRALYGPGGRLLLGEAPEGIPGRMRHFLPGRIWSVRLAKRGRCYYNNTHTIRR